jgi:hypothetical protein
MALSILRMGQFWDDQKEKAQQLCHFVRCPQNIPGHPTQFLYEKVAISKAEKSNP